MYLSKSTNGIIAKFNIPPTRRQIKSSLTFYKIDSKKPAAFNMELVFIFGVRVRIYGQYFNFNVSLEMADVLSTFL